MASTADVCDILELKSDDSKTVTKASIINSGQKKNKTQRECI